MAHVRFTEQERIATSGGEVLKALRADEEDYRVIEEVYLSRVDADAVRAWKCHTKMTVNLVVPMGHVRVVVSEIDKFLTFDLGPEHRYGRLTIEPGCWFGFKGGLNGGLLLNMADSLHDPSEVLARDLSAFPYEW